jgi:hypothetical protein
VGESNRDERLARAMSRLGGRAKIALRSDSEYDEFIVVQNSEDALLLLEIIDAVDALQSQLAHLTQQRDGYREAAERRRKCAGTVRKEPRWTIRHRGGA